MYLDSSMQNFSESLERFYLEVEFMQVFINDLAS